MKKKIEKYICYYLLVYVAVLFACGFFQYLAVCQGKSLECAFSMSGINNIITTTSYVLTPIIAIIGFMTWRNQEEYKKSQDLIESILDKTRELKLTWDESREHGDISRFVEYCMMEQLGTANFDNLELSKSELAKLEKNIYVLDELIFLIDKFYLNSGLDISQLDTVINGANDELRKNVEDLFNFQAQLVQIKYGNEFTIKSPIEMREICNKLDRYCNQMMGTALDIHRQDYSIQIEQYIKKIIDEIIKLKLKI